MKNRWHAPGAPAVLTAPITQQKFVNQDPPTYGTTSCRPHHYRLLYDTTILRCRLDSCSTTTRVEYSAGSGHTTRAVCQERTWLVSSRAASTSSIKQSGGAWYADRASTSASPSRACCPPLSSCGERSTTAVAVVAVVVELVPGVASFRTTRRRPSSSCCMQR